MANTDPRDLILDNLTAAFAAIATGSGYNFTIGEASRGLKHLQNVPESAFPALYVAGSNEVRENVTNRSYKSTMRITVIGYVRHTDAMDTAEIQRSVSKLIQDVYEAANSDPTRGGYATYTEVREIEEDQGVLAPYGAVEIIVVCEYRATFAAP